MKPNVLAKLVKAEFKKKPKKGTGRKVFQEPASMKALQQEQGIYPEDKKKG